MRLAVIVRHGPISGVAADETEFYRSPTTIIFGSSRCASNKNVNLVRLNWTFF